jgi:hypothetical protein
MTEEVHLASEDVIQQSPMSFSGATRRIWRLTRLTENTAGRIGLTALACVLLPLAWAFLGVWYVVVFGLFAIFTIPFRAARRHDRQKKITGLQHQEMMEAVKGQQALAAQQAKALDDGEQPSPPQVAEEPARPEIEPAPEQASGKSRERQLASASSGIE